MKYYQTLFVLICLMTMISLFTDETEADLLKTGTMFIVSIIVVIIACFIHTKENEK